MQKLCSSAVIPDPKTPITPLGESAHPHRAEKPISTAGTPITQCLQTYSLNFGLGEAREKRCNVPAPSLDPGFTKHVAYEYTVGQSPNYLTLFEPARLKQMQTIITGLLAGVCERPIIVPLETIASVLRQCYDSNRPAVGGIYTRYIMPSVEGQRNDKRDIVDRTIEIIVSTIRTEYEVIRNNNKLTVWNSLLGDFNNQGLRAHSDIKLNKRRPNKLFFNMRY